MSDPSRLDHEKLHVYQLAIEFLRLAFRVVAGLPRGEAEVRSQFKRAALSVPLNIAEGAGKPGGPDRARFDAIARGSAMECDALLDVCHLSGNVTDADARDGRALLVPIVSMLSKMCR